MKLNTRLLSFLLAVLFALASLAGCCSSLIPNESITSAPLGSEESSEITTEADDSQSNSTEDSIAENSSESDSESHTESEKKEPEVLDRSEIYEAVNSPDSFSPATSLEDALERSKNGELSGYPFVPDQAPIPSKYRPMKDEMYVKNSDSYYIDINTYVVVDTYGREVFRIYRGGAYITLEEVAAYVYAFGTIPANHSSSKKTSPSSSIWGEYLRVNHSKFTGDTSKYPYEPELPRISGCGGDLTYWEMDIGTTGTDCDPSYSAVIYNNGSRITRGAARIVYTWNDLNGNRMADATDLIYVFYTYNHYNDFQEYLNYYGGWGEMFGNITGGGKISSKTDCNPTEYVPVFNGSLSAEIPSESYVLFAWVDKKSLEILLCA